MAAEMVLLPVSPPGPKSVYVLPLDVCPYARLRGAQQGRDRARAEGHTATRTHMVAFRPCTACCTQSCRAPYTVSWLVCPSNAWCTLHSACCFSDRRCTVCAGFRRGAAGETAAGVLDRRPTHLAAFHVHRLWGPRFPGQQWPHADKDFDGFIVSWRGLQRRGHGAGFGPSRHAERNASLPLASSTLQRGQGRVRREGHCAAIPHALFWRLLCISL